MATVLPLIMKVEKNLKSEKNAKIYSFCNFQGAIRKIRVLTIAAQTFEAGDFLTFS